RTWHQFRRLLRRAGDRHRAAGLDPDPALSAAEHGDLRRLPADHLPAPARDVRATERADMRTRAERNRQRWAILAFSIAILLLSFAVLKSAYYQLVLTQVLLWAVLSL